MTRIPAAWNTASNACVKLASRSCRTNFARAPASSRSMSRFRACWTTQDWTGCSVAPRTRTRRLPCSITASTYITAHRRTTRAAAARQRRPAAADDVAMPPQDRGGSDDQPHRGQPAGWQHPGEQSQPRPVRPRQPRMNARPLAQGDSELMAQHQDLGVLPHASRRDKPSTDTGDNEEDQIQAHKPKIIARPPACKSATNRHARALTLWSPRRIRPGGMRFRHPQAGNGQIVPGRSDGRRRAVFMSASGQLSGRLWAVSRGRRHCMPRWSPPSKPAPSPVMR